MSGAAAATHKKDLVQIIRDNPGCTLLIDGDGWSLLKRPATDNPFSKDSEQWDEANSLASDEDVGADRDVGLAEILEAVAKVAGLDVDRFDLHPEVD